MLEGQKEGERIIKEMDEFLRDRGTLRIHVNCIFEFVEIEPKLQEKMKDFLVDVLEAAKNEISPVIGDIESVVMVGGGYCRRVIFPPPPAGEVCPEGVQILLPDLSHHDEQSAKWVMAHQLAHAALFHWKVTNRDVSAKVDEVNNQAADLLAESWGFGRPETKNQKEVL